MSLNKEKMIVITINIASALFPLAISIVTGGLIALHSHQIEPEKTKSSNKLTCKFTRICLNRKKIFVAGSGLTVILAGLLLWLNIHYVNKLEHFPNYVLVGGEELSPDSRPESSVDPTPTSKKDMKAKVEDESGSVNANSFITRETKTNLPSLSSNPDVSFGEPTAFSINITQPRAPTTSFESPHPHIISQPVSDSGNVPIYATPLPPILTTSSTISTVSSQSPTIAPVTPAIIATEKQSSSKEGE